MFELYPDADRRLAVAQCLPHSFERGRLDERHNLRGAEHWYVARPQGDGGVLNGHRMLDNSHEPDLHRPILPTARPRRSAPIQLAGTPWGAVPGWRPPWLAGNCCVWIGTARRPMPPTVVRCWSA